MIKVDEVQESDKGPAQVSRWCRNHLTPLLIMYLTLPFTEHNGWKAEHNTTITHTHTHTCQHKNHQYRTNTHLDSSCVPSCPPHPLWQRLGRTLSPAFPSFSSHNRVCGTHTGGERERFYQFHQCPRQTNLHINQVGKAINTMITNRNPVSISVSNYFQPITTESLIHLLIHLDYAECWLDIIWAELGQILTG